MGDDHQNSIGRQKIFPAVASRLVVPGTDGTPWRDQSQQGVRLQGTPGPLPVLHPPLMAAGDLLVGRCTCVA